MFEYLEHPADVKIRVKAKSEFDFFSDIVKAVNSVIFDFKPTKYAKKKKITIAAKSFDLLLHDFIDEIVYCANYDHYCTNLVNINIEQKNSKCILVCTLALHKAKPKNYKIEVKAVSFNILYKENKKTKEKICEFVLDI